LRIIPKDQDSKIDVTFGTMDSQEELMSDLAKMESEIREGKFKYKSIMLDSASYWMNIKLLGDFEDQTHDAGIFSGGKERELVNQVRVDQPVYGALASHMNRICKAIKRISQLGIPVVAIAQGIENPKWNREMAVAPHFIGQKFSGDLKSHFDLIGLLVPRHDEHGNMVYPPNVKFGCTDGSFMAKYTGKQLPSLTGPLDFSKIIPEGKGRFILIYSAEAGEGKSTSCLATLPQPILDIYVEDRNPNTSLEALE